MSEGRRVQVAENDQQRQVITAGDLLRRLQPRWAADHPSLPLCLVFLIALILNASIGILCFEPVPQVHDEFAYLLAADTFANGRLSNSPHSHAEHFLSQHVLHSPTRQAKYPPAQGLVLAAGQWLFGAPIWGVWLSLALACAAVCWMLRGWLPPGWAFIGAMLLTVNPMVVRAWGQSYWGGGIALLGGALVFGALPRLTKRRSAIDATALGAGLVILANSRPYEGLLASLVAATFFIHWISCRDFPGCSRLVRTFFFPTALVVFPACGLMLAYNHAVTGDVFTHPYQVWLQSAIGDPSLGKLLSKRDSSADMDLSRLVLPGSPSHWNDELQIYVQSRRSQSMILRKILLPSAFFAGLPLIVVWLTGLVSSVYTSRLRFAFLGIVIVTGATVLNGASAFPHYLAPIGALSVLMVVQGLRVLCVRKGRWPALRSATALVSVVASVVVSMTLLTDYVLSPRDYYRQTSLKRAAVQRQLLDMGGQHVVIVEFGAHDSWHEDFVANDADIDGATVIWARDLGLSKNSDLRSHYPERHFWILKPATMSGDKVLEHWDHDDSRLAGVH